MGMNGKEFSFVKNRAVIIQFAKPTVFTVKRKLPYGIGAKRKPKTFFVVSTVCPRGSIAEWNEEFPDAQVSVGDVVREVNGVKGSASEVKTMLAKDPDDEKDLLVFHYLAR